MTDTYQSASPATRPLDWSPELTEEQWQGLQAQYRAGHSWKMDSLETVDRYVLLAHDLRPDSLKSFKLWVNSVVVGRGLDDPLPSGVAGALVMLHYYVVIRYPQGIIYEINGPRAQGLKKSEAGDIIALAWLSGGPFAINSAAAAAYDYLKEWDDSDAAGWKWPAGWSHDAEAFASGVDFSAATDANEISPGDLAKIKDWHLRVEGDVPQYVTFLAKHYPLALKTFRARMERTVGFGSLPKEFVALCWVHLAASWWRPEALHRAIHMARYFGVKKDHVLQILALTHVYQGHVGMDAVIQAIGDEFDKWD